MEFSEKLKAAMQQLGITQSQVTGMTGCSKAAVSLYLSGKSVPPPDKQRSIAASLGLNPEYFGHDEIPKAVIAPKKIREGAIKQLLVTDAAKLMSMNAETVRKGLQQGVFPWGYAIKTSANRWTYFINAARFAEIEGVAI